MYVTISPFPLFFLFMSERQQCAVWIKKLCDPTACGSGLIDRKNRNMYARLLLHMLKRGVLELPFTCKPEPGSLKTLPTYMVRMPHYIVNLAAFAPSFVLKILLQWVLNQDFFLLEAFTCFWIFISSPSTLTSHWLVALWGTAMQVCLTGWQESWVASLMTVWLSVCLRTDQVPHLLQHITGTVPLHFSSVNSIKIYV